MARPPKLARPPKKQVEDAIKALNGVRREWIRRPGATAVDVGFKIKGRQMTDEVAIRLHVRRKRPIETIDKHEALEPEKQTVEGFQVDVIEAEYGTSQAAGPGSPFVAEAAVDRRGLIDPLVGGVSCGNPRITAGTIGAIVFDRTTGDPCILSNWHVLAGSREAAAGERIWQPARADGGGGIDKVATLTRFRLDRDMDAAIARLNGEREWSRDVLELDPIGAIDPEPRLGTLVRKSGRTTGLTLGMIDGLSMTVAIDYGGGVVQAFEDQIHIVPRPPWPAVDYEVSMGGDSGAVWVDERTGRAIGLHFAGETTATPSDEHALANRMTVVADGLNFSFTPLFRRDPMPEARRRTEIREILCRHLPWLCQPAAEREAAATLDPATPLPAAAGATVDAVVDDLLRALRPPN